MDRRSIVDWFESDIHCGPQFIQITSRTELLVHIEGTYIIVAKQVQIKDKQNTWIRGIDANSGHRLLRH